MPLPRGGTKEVGGGRFKSRELIIHGTAVLVFRDIHACFVDGFDDNAAFGLGDVAPAGVQNMIPMLTGAGDPDYTVLALNRHPMLVIIQAQHLALMKK
jgi:hypothetical protein